MKSRHGGASDVPEGYDPAGYERPSVTTDVVLFTLRDKRLEVLLIKRKKKPCEGMWGFPGGFVNMDEKLENAALRELKEETAVDDVYLEQLFAYGDPDRDPRTRVITIAFVGLAPRDKLKTKAGDDAAEAGWFSAYDPPELAFDHAQILDDALKRLRRRVWEAPLIFELLPECFLIDDIWEAYETVMNDKVNARDVKRVVETMGELVSCEETPSAETKETRLTYKFAPNQ